MNSVSQQLENLGAVDSLLRQLSNENNKISAQLARDIANGEIVARKTVEYIRAQVTSVTDGEIELLKSSTDIAEAVSTFKGKELPSGKALIVIGAKVLYGAGASIEAAAMSTVLPDELKNSHVIVKNRGVEMLNVPGSLFSGGEDVEGPNASFFRFDTPLFLADGASTEFRLHVPSNVTFPDNTGGEKFVEVQLIAYKTVSRA